MQFDPPWPLRSIAKRPQDAVPAAAWRRHLSALAVLVGGTLCLLAALIALVDPYGSGLPTALAIERPPMSASQRFVFPAIVRSGRYDSYIVGMSSSRPLDPVALSREIGGRFAHVGMNGATPWEQRLMGLLAARHWRTAGGTLVWSLDRPWCLEDTAPVGHRESPAPEWLYDGSVWNDLPHLLNGKAIEAAGAIIGYNLGMASPRIRADGYLVETPDEATYDVRKVRRLLGKDGDGGGDVAGLEPVAPATALSGRFPALAWIGEVLSALPREARKVLVLIPPHAANLPTRGSGAERRLKACKAELAHLAGRHGAFLVDFRAATRLTTADENFWDGVHFRRHVAAWIVADIGRALRGEKGEHSLLIAAPDGR